MRAKDSGTARFGPGARPRGAVAAPTRFSYSPRHRWAFLPTIAFFVFLLLSLWLRPSLLWGGEVDERTRTAGMLLSGVGVIFLGVALVRRFMTEPHVVELQRNAMVLWPLLGKPRRVPYEDIESAEERTRPGLRGSVELELRTKPWRRIVIRGDIGDYPRLRRLVLERLPPVARERWIEPE
jgi:hypothetical protein